MPATIRTRSTSREDRVQAVARPRNDAYTILLLISLLATVAGCVMLYLDFSKYPEGQPKSPTGSSQIKLLAPDASPQAGRPGR